MSGGGVCPRATGRHSLRRKKNCVLLVAVLLTLLYLIQLSQYNDGYTPLQPLADAKSEAKRLLKFITHYHVQCNVTLQVGNRSHWPLCIERDIGIDLDVKEKRIAYSIGSHGDYLMERELAQNHSFAVFLITHDHVPPQYASVNNTRVIDTILVPNDPADFSRNLYGQQTINDLLLSLGHRHVDWLKLASTVNPAHMWEMLHFMIEDNLFLNVKQLHVAMYIDKLDDDYLYNWYRIVHNLFYKQGLRLYHTSSADSLCLQVTMMESCVYYMSFIQNPGPKVFVLHPPAGYGDAEMEEVRLLSLLGSMETECKQEIIGGPNEQDLLHFKSATQPQWQVCASGLYQLFPLPCHVFRFRLNNDHSLEQKFIHEGCSVHTIEPVFTSHPTKYRVHSHFPANVKQTKKPVGGGEVVGTESLSSLLLAVPSISLLELDVPGREWEVLAVLLDTPGLLHNVSQIVAYLQLPSVVGTTKGRGGGGGTTATTLRSHYSQLQRLHMLGFRLFHSEVVPPPPLREQNRQRQVLAPNCCHKVGYIRRTDWYS